MIVNMDGLRRNLAAAYRKTLYAYRLALLEQTRNVELEEGLKEMRSMIDGLMCVYSDDPEELMSDMSNDIEKLLPLVDL